MLYLSKQYIKGNHMANVENLEKKFLQQLQQPESFAIALTGEWGIGKTHFWKSFYDKNRENFAHKKYAYVSLFGIESLESLGYEIAIKSQGTSTTEKENEKNSKVKSFFTNMMQHIDIPKIESNGFALSIGQNLVSSIISNMVSETIICIDDLERKSDKLDMKDLMGFISQLKTEKNCQVIVILHQDKVNEQNTDFQEYREKVFDDVFYLTDNFSIIKEIIKNHEMLDIYQEFYNKLQVKNLRFYQKVYQDFQQIMSLEHDFSYTSKANILKNLLIIRLADLQQPKISYMKENNEKQFIFNLDFLLNFPKDKNDYDLARYYHEYSDNFFSIFDMDNWTRIVMSNLINHETDTNLLKELVDKDELSEKNQILLTEHRALLKKIKNFDIDNNFIEELYDSMVKIIPCTHFEHLYESYHILSSTNTKLANEYFDKFEEFIKNKIKTSKNPRVIINDFMYYYPQKKDNIFYQKLLNILKDHEKSHDYMYFFQTGGLINFSYRHYELNEIAHQCHQEKLNNIDKDSLHNILWVKNHRCFDRKTWIAFIINNRLLSKEKQEQVRQWIVELLEEKIKNNPNNKAVIQYWLTSTNNFENWIKNEHFSPSPFKKSSFLQ